MAQDIMINQVDKNNTLIQVTKQTALLLKNRAITPRESYDEIIDRLLFDLEDSKKMNQVKGYKIQRLRKR